MSPVTIYQSTRLNTPDDLSLGHTTHRTHSSSKDRNMNPHYNKTSNPTKTSLRRLKRKDWKRKARTGNGHNHHRLAPSCLSPVTAGKFRDCARPQSLPSKFLQFISHPVTLNWLAAAAAAIIVTILTMLPIGPL